MTTKIVFALLFSATLAIGVLDNQNYDFITNKELLIVYADGAPKNIINTRQPIVQSYREGGFEIRNLCETINCDYNFIDVDRYPNRFRSNKCYLIQSPRLCDSKYESQTVTTIEQIIHESDFAMSLDLDGEQYSILANSKTEDSLIMLSEDGFTVQYQNGPLSKLVKL